MKIIRKSIFETNSSSTHSICISPSNYNIPKSIHFEFGEFGWEEDIFEDMQSKASYLYTGLIQNDNKDRFDEIVNMLKNKNIEVTISNKLEGYFTEGYIDHGGFEDVFCEEEWYNNDELVMNFLFNSDSIVISGNDNSDRCVNILAYKRYPTHQIIPPTSDWVINEMDDYDEDGNRKQER